jgi:hypothetical protein
MQRIEKEDADYILRRLQDIERRIAVMQEREEGENAGP